MCQGAHNNNNNKLRARLPMTIIHPGGRPGGARIHAAHLLRAGRARRPEARRATVTRALEFCFEPLNGPEIDSCKPSLAASGAAQPRQQQQRQRKQQWPP
jgi:hypothetical protein